MHLSLFPRWVHLLVVPSREAAVRGAHETALGALAARDKERGGAAVVRVLVAFHSKAVHRAWVKLVKVSQE